MLDCVQQIAKKETSKTNKQGNEIKGSNFSTTKTLLCSKCRRFVKCWCDVTGDVTVYVHDFSHIC